MDRGRGKLLAGADAAAGSVGAEDGAVVAAGVVVMCAAGAMGAVAWAPASAGPFTA